MSRLKVHYGKEIRIFDEVDEEETLLDFLKEKGFEIAAECGGVGKCGSCLVTLVKDGKKKDVLSCMTKIEGDMEIIVPEYTMEELKISINSTIGLNQEKTGLQRRKGIGCAVDLGTTTIALKTFDLATAKLLGVESTWNPQIPFGSDVISRIQYINTHENGLKQLSDLVWNEIKSQIEKTLIESGRSISELTEIVISGNTVMEHILFMKNPATIAVAPFKPQTLFYDKENYEETFYTAPESANLDHVTIRLMPCVSGYVGGDIVSGMYAGHLTESEKPVFFIDLGTNGEMAVGSGTDFKACSVATGPAFEGAEISCGTRAKKGAVSHVNLDAEGNIVLEIIGSQKAKGICGSGLIDLLAILLDKGIIDNTGCLRELSGKECETFYLTENKKVYLTSKDVRKLQLAKAAVKAGMEILLKETGLKVDEVGRVYIAGGFGENLNVESAARIGLIIPELKDKVKFVGNTSLEGAVKILLNPEDMTEVVKTRNAINYIELSESIEFSEAYVDNMHFKRLKLEYTDKQSPINNIKNQ